MSRNLLGDITDLVIPLERGGWGKGTAYMTKQVQRLTGATARQLRYWDQVGLVKPSVQGTGGRSGKPRLYNARDVGKIRAIVTLMYKGYSLQRIRKEVA